MPRREIDIYVGELKFMYMPLPADVGLGMLSKLLLIGGEGLVELLNAFEIVEVPVLNDDDEPVLNKNGKPEKRTTTFFNAELVNIGDIGKKILGEIRKNDPSLSIVKELLLYQGCSYYYDEYGCKSNMTKESFNTLFEANYVGIFKLFYEVCKINGFLFGITGSLSTN